jgi:hypothetical protein
MGDTNSATYKMDMKMPAKRTVATRRGRAKWEGHTQRTRKALAMGWDAMVVERA